MEFVFTIFGIALIGASLLQFGLWTTAGLRRLSLDKKKYEVELQLLRAQIYEITKQREQPDHDLPSMILDESDDVQIAELPKSAAKPNEPSVNWIGFRKFRVAKLENETAQCTSVYLEPADGQSLPTYRPGQHLTLKFSILGAEQPAIRCYTLSDSANSTAYRITVKKLSADFAESGIKPAFVSSFVNRQLKVDDIIEVKPPSGSFYLQPGDHPVVLLAGGVGITPMMSMINYVISNQPTRQVLLVYGARNGNEHIFQKQIKQIAAEHENIHVVNCYSSPGESDVANRDYHVCGYVSIDVLKRLLPDNNQEYYLCGPPEFMESLYGGLLEWGISQQQIHYEAFGPASIKKIDRSPNAPADTSAENETPAPQVVFAQSAASANWNKQCENLLEFAEASDISIPSGCRAGSCGTCATRIIKGNVRYSNDEQFECEPGWCLPCVSSPLGPLELDV